MFYLIGLGLGDAKDITVKGLEIVKKCDRVYLEAYTSILTIGKENLEEFYGRKLLVADRELVENNADIILENADKEDIAFLVVGDPFGATTHTDLVLRLQQQKIKFQVIHNASIINAVGCCGLQLYSFGEIVSIPLWTETWQPDSFYDKILGNYKRNLHTLCLLDIKVKEPTLDSIVKKTKFYMPPKFMSVSEAADQLLQILEKKQSLSDQELTLTHSSLVVGLARIGANDQEICICSLSKMRKIDLGLPLHCLVIPGNSLHPLESEFLLQYAVDDKELQLLKH
ncbi:PREDICTED: diphthine synthase [Ceratosolen solmsi marchali]|uniref:diphthine methyl ester synthase n=1 Tax=Ceratosolen solmsi marchali TaxID=326594 RepID=A0AAJ7E1G2_9HYME|nr:PREDICTED: diphthine synthase [Ceratosolen solmsi marchali]